MGLNNERGALRERVNWVEKSVYLMLFMAMGMVFAGMIWREKRNQHRLETMPHVPGTILSVEQPGKGGTRAWIEFVRIDDEERIVCRAEVRFPNGSVTVGQRVSVVPREGTCGEPSVAIRR